MTLKQLLNLNVYDEKGTNLGQIRDVTFDKATGKCLLITNDAAYAANKLLKKGANGAIGSFQKNENVYPTIAGKKAYDTLGRLLGTVVNATIGKSMILGKLYLDNGDMYNRGQIAALNDVFLIKIVKRRAQKKEKREPEHMPIRASKQPSAKPANTASNSGSLRRRYGDFSFLLGKTADKNITNFFGEVMIRAGETVTVDILRQAKISGKLIELCLHASH